VFDRKRDLIHLLASFKRKSEEAIATAETNRQGELANRKDLKMEDEPWMSDEQWSEKVVKYIGDSMNARSKWSESVEKELTEVGISVDWRAEIAFKGDTEQAEVVDQVEASSPSVRPSLRRS
jgi:hypothetical protein